ncbi:hypothetical protein DP179_14450 [Enterobacter roggenkampii]|nr:hypothetical protein [Enterobacter roggenkampii]RAY75273.1 hypothetical protein DP179_14450 [Enterobacter roggenkampii]
MVSLPTRCTMTNRQAASLRKFSVSRWHRSKRRLWHGCGHTENTRAKYLSLGRKMMRELKALTGLGGVVRRFMQPSQRRQQ